MTRHRDLLVYLVLAIICLVLISGNAILLAQSCNPGGSTMPGDERYECGWYPLSSISGPAEVTTPGGYQYTASGGKAPYQWSTSTGSIDESGYLTLGEDDCGAVTITAVDECGESSSLTARITNRGHWAESCISGYPWHGACGVAPPGEESISGDTWVIKYNYCAVPYEGVEGSHYDCGEYTCSPPLGVCQELNPYPSPCSAVYCRVEVRKWQCD